MMPTVRSDDTLIADLTDVIDAMFDHLDDSEDVAREVARITLEAVRFYERCMAIEACGDPKLPLVTSSERFAKRIGVELRECTPTNEEIAAAALEGRE